MEIYQHLSSFFLPYKAQTQIYKEKIADLEKQLGEKGSSGAEPDLPARDTGMFATWCMLFKT